MTVFTHILSICHVLARNDTPHYDASNFILKEKKTMLEFLRNKASGVLGILLIGLLVIAFGLWGIADTFTGFSNAELGRVGGEKIERQEFQLRYMQSTQQLAQQLGAPLSAAQARNLGVPQQVMANMLGGAAMRELGSDLGLAYSDEDIAKSIVNDANFAGPSGSFDEPTFRTVLAQNGLSEEMFVKDQRSFHIINQLTEASVDNGLMPDALADGLFKHFLERRVAKYMILTLDETDEVGDPTDEELETFFSQTKLRFAEPERRSGQALLISPARFAELISIEEETLREEYEISLSDFSVPEKREIDQLVLSDDEQVETVRNMRAEGKSFVEILQAVGQTLDNTDLGKVERDDLISADLAEVAFSMESGEISDIIEGPLGYAVLRVRSITPGATLPFEAVKDRLLSRIVYDQALEDMLAFSETVEDELAGGETLASLGQRFDLDVVQIEDIDNDGANRDGRRLNLLAIYEEIAPTLFESAVGEDIPMMENDDGSYIWLRLDAITPSEVPPLADIRDAVAAEWQVSERTKLLEAMAAHMVKEGNETGSFNKAAKTFEREPLVSEPMTRQTSNDTFSEAAVARLFSVNDGKFAWASVGFGGEIIVMQVDEIIEAAVNEGEAKDLIFGGEQRKYRLDLSNQFITGLQNEYGASVNQSNLERAINDLVTR